MMRVAAVQMTSTEDRTLNLKKAIDWIEEAVQHKADLIAFPEHFSYLTMDNNPIPFTESTHGELVSSFCSLAQKFSIHILLGSFAEKINASSKTYNTSVFIDSTGIVLGSYRKIHLFDYQGRSGQVYHESHLVVPGDRPVIFDTNFGKVGIAICYDLRFPELFRQLALRGARILFLPSAFTMNTGKDHWEILLRARAIENQVYIVAPNQWGLHSEGRESYGNSMILDPWGRMLACADDLEGVIYADLDFDYLDEVRSKLPALHHIQETLFPESLGRAVL